MLCCVSKRAVDGDYGPPYESCTRTDELPALLEKIEIELYPEEDVLPNLLPCAICARTFMPESLEKHKKICEKAALKKRKPFDSAKQRIQGTDLADFLPKQEKKRQEDSKTNRSAWKQTHNEFLRTIRAARVESSNKLISYQGNEIHQVDGPPQHAASSQITASAPTRGNEKGTCPTCNRHFGIKAYDRHVAWCKERSTRLPTNPVTNLAKERFEARMKYRAPGLKNRRPTNREKYSPGSAVTLTVNNNNDNINNNNGTSIVNKSSPQQVKAKGSISLPNCNKNNDSVVTQKSIRNRRSAQRGVLDFSGPIKSRVADRTNRTTKNYAPFVQTPRTPNSPQPSPIADISVAKSRQNSGTSELLKINALGLLNSAKMKTRKEIRRKIQTSHSELNSPRTKDENRYQTITSARLQKMNIVSARSQGHPKINDVAINRELKSMTVQRCIIHKDEGLITCKQISHERCQQILDEENDSALQYLKGFRLPNIDNHRNDDVNDGNVSIENFELKKLQYLDTETCKEQKLRMDDNIKDDYDLKTTEQKELSSEVYGMEKCNTGACPETCSLQEEQETDVKNSTIKSANVEGFEILFNDNVKLNKWAQVTERLDQTYLITDSKIENSNIKSDESFGTDRKLELKAVSPRTEFPLKQPIISNTNINYEIKLPKNSTVNESDDLINFSKRSKTNSHTSRNLENNDSEEKIEVIDLINENNQTRSISTEYLNDKCSLDTLSATLSESNYNQENCLIGKMEHCNEEKNSVNNMRVSTQSQLNESFEMVNISSIHSSTPIEILSELDNGEQCNSVRSNTSVADKSKLFLSPNVQHNNDEWKLNNDCSHEMAIEKNRSASPYTIELPEIMQIENDNKAFGEIHEIYSLQEDSKQPAKSLNQFNSENVDDVVYSNNDTWMHENLSNRPNNRLFIPEQIVRVANDVSDDTKNNKDIDIGEKYINSNFNYNSDAARKHAMLCHFKNAVQTDSFAAMKSSLKRSVSSRSAEKQNEAGTYIQLGSRSLGKIVEHESSKDGDRRTTDEMHRKVRQTMHLLRDSTDTLISSVEAPIMDNYKHANVINVVQVGRIEETDRKTQSIVFRTSSEICNELKDIKTGTKAEGKSDASTMTYWKKMSNVKNSILINLDPPQRERYRLLKRNPKIHILPPVPSYATKTKRRNFTLPLRPVWSSYVRRRPDFNLVLRGRIGSTDYDPFMLAEQQMCELLSDTSDQSDMTTSTHTNKNNLFPLTHSSAFVKYPFEFTNHKRSSLIAPPTEFNDLASDFSSDSTETNSLSREIFLGDLYNSTESSFSELTDKTNKKVFPVKKLGRRAIIDKSKALGNNIIESTIIHGNKSFVGNGDQARKILDRVTPKASPKAVRLIANRSHSCRASSAPKSTPERKSNTYSSAVPCSRRSTNSQLNQSNQPDKKCLNKPEDERSYVPLSGSNLSLNSIISSPEIDVKRSNSAFDELLTSFEEDRTTPFPSLKSFLKDSSLTVPSHPPTVDGQHHNGHNSDEELSSPDSYKRQEHGKLSADSAYSSLNRKYSHHGRNTNDVGRFEEDGLRKHNRITIDTETKYKMSKFCHECGMKFPDTAKFCCECGVKRLAL